MNRLVVLLACFLFFGTLTAQDQTPRAAKQYTQISGEIRNASDRSVGITFFSDMISFTEELYQVPLDSLHRFSMRFQLNEATQINFEYRGQSLRFYLEPGDDLRLRFDGNNFYRTLVIEGNGATQNYYLQQAHRLHGHWDEVNILYEMAQREPMDFRRYMDGLRRQKWSFINQFPGKEKFSEGFLYYAAADIDYWWAYFLLRYRMEHYVAQGKVQGTMPERYYTFLEDLVVSNDRATSNPYYLFFLDQYLLYKEESTKSEKPKAASEKAVNILVSVPSLFIMSQPEQQPIVTEVRKGDRMRYLGEKSTFKSKIMIKEALHEAYWYKVKTGDGYIGWAIGVGLLFEKEISADTTTIVTPEKKRQQTALRELKGKALYYTLANDLYFRAQNLSLEELEKEVKAFDFLNPIKSYDQTLRHTLAVAKATENPDLKYGATNYRIISEPEIMTVRKGRVVVVNERPLKPLNRLEEVELNVLDHGREMGVSENVIVLLDEMYEKKKREASGGPVVEKEDKVAAAAVGPTKKAPKPINARPSEYVNIPLPAEDRPSSLASMKGKLENNTMKGLKLVLYSDPITFIEEVRELKINPDNSFNLDVNLRQAQMGYLAYGESKTPIYLAPGDQLNIRFNAVHFYKTLHFVGKGNTSNNYLLAKRKRFENEDEDLRKQMKNLAPAEFLVYMEEQRTLRMEFLGNYEKSYSFESDFAALAKAEVIYWYANQLMNYPWEHPLYHDEEAPMALPANYYDFLQTIEVSDPDGLAYEQYTYFLDQYFDYLIDLPENNGFTKVELAEQHLDNEALAFYKARLFTIACKRGKAKA
ncbi:MAG: hypothetical protein ACI956_001837, partial [Nonlabens sp.]